MRYDLDSEADYASTCDWFGSTLFRTAGSGAVRKYNFWHCASYYNHLNTHSSSPQALYKVSVERESNIFLLKTAKNFTRNTFFVAVLSAQGENYCYRIQIVKIMYETNIYKINKIIYVAWNYTHYVTNLFYIWRLTEKKKPFFGGIKPTLQVETKVIKGDNHMERGALVGEVKGKDGGSKITSSKKW